MFHLIKTRYYLKHLLPKNYVDIHNHLLPGIDDGAKTVQETSELIKQMKELNIERGIATPHTFNLKWKNTTENIKTAFNKACEQNANKKFLKSYASEYIDELVRRLRTEGISTVFRKSEKGLLYGITYVDHTTKNVFNGSSLGKQYSAKAIEKRCGLKVEGEEKRKQIYEKLRSKEALITFLEQQKNILTIADVVKVMHVLKLEGKQYFAMLPKLDKIIDNLIEAQQTMDYLPYHLKNKKKKQRRRGFSM